MPFDKETFIEEQGRNAFRMLKDFLDCEIDPEWSDEMIFLILAENITDFHYEGNQFSISKSKGSTLIKIVDEVSLEHGVVPEQCTFYLEGSDLAELIRKRAQELQNSNSLL